VTNDVFGRESSEQSKQASVGRSRKEPSLHMLEYSLQLREESGALLLDATGPVPYLYDELVRQTSARPPHRPPQVWVDGGSPSSQSRGAAARTHIQLGSAVDLDALLQSSLRLGRAKLCLCTAPLAASSRGSFRLARDQAPLLALCSQDPKVGQTLARKLSGEKLLAKQFEREEAQVRGELGRKMTSENLMRFLSDAKSPAATEYTCGASGLGL
jgi:hypothetical protein